MKGRSRKRTGIWFALIALCLFSVFPLVTRAQANQYSFSALSETYTPITGGTVLNASIPDSWQSGQVAMSPGFTFNGVTYTYAYVTSNGLISLGGTAGPGTTEYNGIANNANGSGIHLCPFNADLNGAATGTPEIRFETVGTEHVFQWQDARRYNLSGERISFQVRLNTGTGEIKFVYGGTINVGTGTSYQPVIGIRTAANAYKNLSIGTGAETWAAPLAGTATGNTCRFTSDVPAKSPVVGQAYLFTPPPPCTGTPVAGTVAPLLQNLCNGATPAAIVATGYTTGATGITFQWEKSNDDGVTDPWVNVTGGTGATTVSYTPPAFAGTPVYYRLKVTCTNGGASATSGSAQVAGMISPATAASAIVFSNQTPSSMTIGWTSGNGGRRFAVINTANTFTDPVNGATGPATANAVYAGSGQQVIYDGTGTSVDVSGLACNTTYFVRVYEYNRCGTSPSFTYYYNTTTSGTNPLSQATAALPAAVNLPVNNNFTGFTGANLATVFPGWREAAIVTAGGSAPTQVNPSGTGSAWLSSTAFTATTAKVNLYTNTRNEWIISPKMTITAPFTLEFKAAITDYNSAAADAAGMQGTDDKVNVLISTDPCGSSWTNIYTFDASNTTTLTNALRQFTFYLGAPYIGQTVQIAFQATDGPVSNTPDYDFHIGDVKISQTPTCILPTALTVSGVAAHSATLTWTAPAAGNAPSAYLWKVVASGAGANGAAVSSGSVTAPALTTSAAGLASNTNYDAYVRSVCGAGDTSAWSSTASFLTLCDAFNTFPFTETFETASPSRNCWTQIQVAGTSSWTYATGSNSGAITAAQQGSLNARFVAVTGTNTPITKLVSPVFDLTAVSNPRVTFYLGQEVRAGNQNTTKLYYRISPSDPWVEIGNYTASIAAWTQFAVALPNPSATYQIAFEGINNNGRANVVDNVVVERTPTCYPPTAPVVSNIGISTADLAWTAPAQGTPSTYLWKAVAAGGNVNGAALASGSVAAPAVTTTMTGLPAATAFDVYIRSVCSAGDTSAWSAKVSFTSLCDIANVPYTLDFETAVVPALPLCTSRENAGTGNNWATNSPGTSGFFSKTLRYSYNSSNPANAWFYTKAINLTGGVSYRLSYRYGCGDADYAERMKVYYGTTAASASMTNVLATHASITNDITPIINTLDFTPATTGVYYIAFQCYSPTDYYNLYLDDIHVDLSPTCTPPTNLVVSNVGSTTATLTWAVPPIGTPANYLWKAVAAGAGPNAAALATGSVAAPALTTTMTGLPVATSFDVYMRTDCGGADSSVWSVPQSSATGQIPVSTYPYDQGFESGLDSWQAGNGTEPNKWVVGTATNNGGTQALYVSNDNGVSNAYTTGTASVTHVYRDFQIPAGFPLINLRFDWKAAGETPAYDRMRVYLAPVSFIPTPGTQITAAGTAPAGIVRLGAEFNNQGTFTVANYTLPSAYDNQTFRLIFEWRNDGGSGTQPPAAVDNIHVEVSSCAPPTTLTATTTATGASLGWTQPGTITSWDVEYGPVGFTQGTGTQVNDTSANPLTISGLTPLTSYSYYVRANCGGPESAWAGPFTFTTLCQPYDITGTTPATRCGSGSVQLAATSAPGAVLKWYAAASGGTALATGDTFTTPVIDSTTTYYVEANTIAPSTMALGAGASTSTDNPYNFANGGYGGMKTQYIYTAAELTAAGLRPGNITALAYEFTVAGARLDSFAVQMGTTTLSDFPATINILGGQTTVKNYANMIPVVGVNTITFDTPFNWDGTSNIIVSLSWSNGLTSNSPSSSIKYDAVGAARSQATRRDNQTAAYMFAFTGAPANGSYQNSTNRPRTIFSGMVNACTSARTAVVATVTAPPAIIASNDTSICAGQTAVLGVSSANTGYTYTWTPGTGTGNSFSVTPTATTIYTVTATDNSGGANDGCASRKNVTVTVNEVPPSPGVTPATASLCLGSSQTLTAASVGLPTPIFTENFEAATHAFTAVNTSTGTNPANADWTVRNDGYVYNGTTAVTFHSPDNSKFILSNSDAIGQGANTNTILTSPVINTTGYAGLSLKFDHTTRIFGSNPHSKVEVSTNGGTSWTTLADYTTDLGTSTGFVSQTINLDTYINNPNFRFRFAYTAAWSWYWAIDNVVLSGNTPLATSWVATPSADAGLPAGAGTPSTSNGSISVTPTAAGAYVYTAVTQTPQGCVSQPSSSVVTVNPLPTVDAGPTQNVCPRTPITLSGSGAATYTWDNGVTNGVAFPAPTATTLYTVTGRDANNCSSTDTVTVIAKPTTPASITADGALTYCANQTRTLTAVGGGTGPYTYAWTPGGQTTQTIQPTATGTYTVTITEAGVCSGQASSSVTVNPVVTTTLNRTICSNQTYTLVDNTVVNTAGTYTKTTTAATGCDSIVTVILTVNPTRTSNISVNLCQGASYTLVDGTVVNTAGTYTATTNNSSTGCDSTVTATVTVRPTYNTPVTARICQGATYTLANGTQVNTAGVHTVTVPSVNGCDSTVAVTLTVIAPITRTATASICSGNSYTLPNGTQVTTAGVYTSTLTSGVTGCDSIIVTTLTVNPSPNLNLGADITAVNPPVLLNAGAGFTSYLWNTGATTQSITVNTAGTYSVTVKNQFNCTATDTVKVTFTASIVNLGDNGGSISLFPNPTSDRFTLNVYGYTGGGKMVFDVINAVGQVVRTEAIGNATENFTKEMEISTLASGTYTLRVRGTNATANLRFVIAR